MVARLETCKLEGQTLDAAKLSLAGIFTPSTIETYARRSSGFILTNHSVSGT